MDKMNFSEEIFNIRSAGEFNDLAIRVFRYQAETNPVYREFVNTLAVNPGEVDRLDNIPFLPVSFFKTRTIISGNMEPGLLFLSSGTTGMERSSHYVADAEVYKSSLLKGFEYAYGDPAGYKFLGLVPEPSLHPHSSLAWMVNAFMETAHPGEKYFFPDDFSSLNEKIEFFGKMGISTILIGLTSALLDFSERFAPSNPGLIVMETGGMKGKRKELIREELHSILCRQFGVQVIHSEYGMTELLSQAYSKGSGLFSSPPWMKILIRDSNDPLTLLKTEQTGGVNIIDLANFNSCSFIATQDLGRLHGDGSFEVLGRFDNSELRGCNLMIT
jgi:hypothetical protein